MVRHYPRLPAVLVLMVAVVISAIYVRVSGKAALSGTLGGGATLEQLEKDIHQDKADATTWNAYGHLLLDAKPPRFDRAALAFRKVLEKKPDDREAKLHCASALAQVQNGAVAADEFYNYLRDLLVSGEPKVVMDIFAQPECQVHLSQARFATLQKEARAQAMD